MRVSDDRMVCTYDSPDSEEIISIGNTMSNMHLSFYINKNMSYECTGNFRYTVYGIL